MSIRVTQDGLGALIAPTSAKILVTQEGLSALVVPTSAKMHVTQVGLSVLTVIPPSSTPKFYAQIII